jgi:hypothetical protein
VFICVKNNITCSELWVDEDFDMLAVEIEGSDPKYLLEVVGTNGVPNEDIRVIEKLVERIGFFKNCMKHSIIGVELNFLQVDWKGVTEGISVSRTGVGQRLHADSWKAKSRGFITERLSCLTRKCIYILRYGTRDQ